MSINIQGGSCCWCAAPAESVGETLLNAARCSDIVIADVWSEFVAFPFAAGKVVRPMTGLKRVRGDGGGGVLRTRNVGIAAGVVLLASMGIAPSLAPCSGRCCLGVCAA